MLSTKRLMKVESTLKCNNLFNAFKAWIYFDWSIHDPQTTYSYEIISKCKHQRVQCVTFAATSVNKENNNYETKAYQTFNMHINMFVRGIIFQLTIVIITAYQTLNTIIIPPIISKENARIILSWSINYD